MINRLHNHRHQPPPRAIESPLPEDAIRALDGAHAAPEGLLERASRTVTNHPAVAIGAAFAVGILLGKWVKR